MRHSRWWIKMICGLAVLILSAAAGLVRAEFEVSWYSIDSGGAVVRAPNGLTVRGVLGQADAGILSGGAFAVTGGVLLPSPPGDCNQDGLADLLDYGELSACLGGPGVGVPSPDCRCFDADGDEDIDLDDVGRFQRGYTYP
jgi:hypothetical protein